MHDYQLLQIFATGFFFALIFGYAAHRIGLSPIVGYLLAGFLVGPETPFPFTADFALASQLSDVGVILLMFGVGLRFDTKDLLAVKDVVVPGALAQSSLTTMLGALVGVGLGLGFGQSLMMGMGLSVASTVVMMRVLGDNGMLNSATGHIAVGWLVVEDLIAVLMLVLLPTLATMLSGSASSPMDILQAIGMALVRLAALWALVIVVGGKLVPWLLAKVVRTRSEELFTLSVLVCAFATAVVAALFFEVSMALGAFLGGMVIGRTKVSYQAGADILPLRDAFAVIFFISVGMLFRPSFFLEQPLLIAGCLAIVIFAKPFFATTLVCLLGYSSSTAITMGVSLSQIGEFSFILAQGAIGLNLIPIDVYNVLVVCSILSIALNPVLVRQVPKILRFVDSRPGLLKIMNARAESKAARQNLNAAKKAQKAQGSSGKTLPGTGQKIPAAFALPDFNDMLTAVVVGYGPVGQLVTETLLKRHFLPVVIDMNVDTVNRLNAEKICPAVFGNSTKKDVLLGAKLDKANYLIITVPNAEQAMVTATVAKQLNPDIRVLVRARFLRDERLFEQIGINEVAYEEKAVAHRLADLLDKDIEGCKTQSNACAVDFNRLESEDFNAVKDLSFKIFG